MPIDPGRFRGAASPSGTNQPIGGWKESDLLRWFQGVMRGSKATAPSKHQVVDVYDKLTVRDKIQLSPQAAQSIADTPEVSAAISAGSPVKSVFGRVGAVVAQAGDYLASQVTNAADKATTATQTFTGDLSLNGATFDRTVSGWYIHSPGSGTNTTHSWLLGTSPTAADRMIGLGVHGDATDWRFLAYSDGMLQWGPGTTAPDTNLYRSAANTLQTDDTLVPNGGIYMVRASNANVLENFFLAGDTQPAFKLFAQGAMTWGPGGTTAPDIELARIVNSPSGTGSYLEIINGDGLGYGAGTGGVVTQATSFSTAVTINKPTGEITLFSSAISAGLTITFIVNNSVVGVHDTVVLTGQNMAGIQITASHITNGLFYVTWYSPGALGSATRKINFAVIKGSTN